MAGVSRASYYRFDESAEAGTDPDMDLRDAIQRIGVLEDIERLLGRRQRYRVRRVGAAMRHALADFTHDLLASREHRDRITVRHGLGEGVIVLDDQHTSAIPTHCK